MKIKDSFVLGVVVSIAIFLALYTTINLFTDYPFFSQSRDSLWVYILSLVPNLLLSRFMLVNWNLYSLGRGVLLTTLISIISLMFFVLR